MLSAGQTLALAQQQALRAAERAARVAAAALARAHTQAVLRGLTVVLVAALGGSACTADVADMPTCDPDGTYRLQWIPKSGDCPEIETVARVRRGGQPQQGCTGMNDWSPDGCSVQIDLECQSDAGGIPVKMEFTGAITFDLDGSGGRGTADLTVRDAATGALECSSILDVRYTAVD